MSASASKLPPPGPLPSSPPPSPSAPTIRSKPSVRPALRREVIAFYGFVPPTNLKAYAVFYEGALAAIGGVAIEKGHYRMFYDARDGDYPPRAIWQAACEVVERLRGLPLPIIAVADKHRETAPRFLMRLGFAYLHPSDEGDIYYLKDT